MGNEELDNNSENTEFNYVQEKIKPKSRKRLKKVLSVIGLSILAGVICGITSRVAFLKIGDPVAKLLGIEPVSGKEPIEPTGSGRNPVRFPTNPVTPRPTPKPTPTPALKPTPSAAEKPTSGQTDISAGLTPTGTEAATGTQSVTDMPTVTTTSVPTSTSAPTVTATPTNEPDDVTGTPGPDDDGNNDDGNDVTPTLSPIDSYIGMITQMREVAGKVQKSLVRVYSVITEANWLGESIETRQCFSRVVSSGLLPERTASRSNLTKNTVLLFTAMIKIPILR